jgi:hypothetical protein
VTPSPVDSSTWQVRCDRPPYPQSGLAQRDLAVRRQSTIALGVFNLQVNATYGANWPVLAVKG